MRLLYSLGIFLSFFLLFSCKKNNLPEIPTPPVGTDVTVPPKDTTNNKPPVTGRIIPLGTGSGDLVINGTTLALQCNDVIKIAKGSYSSISIENIQAAEGCTISVVNDGLVEIKGNHNQMNLKNLKGVKISGTGDANLKYGFQFHDNVYRSIVISQPYNDCTIENVSFKNIGDYVITYYSDLKYNGSPASYSKNLKFLNLSCDNTSRLIYFPGQVEYGTVTGLIKGLEIANLDFRNSTTAGSLVWIGNVDEYLIHHNRIDNVNASNNEHNGIFQLMGNGKFYNNYISNHQGNAIRAWAYSIGNTPKEILIYNNIVVNSRKYSAFEAQSFPAFLGNSSTYANVKVYNNTCGNLNTSKDWYGSVVDVYDLQGGKIEVFNNIGFNFPLPNPSNNISNLQSSTTRPEDSNNLYFNSAAEAGFSNESKFTLSATSKAKNKGKGTPSLTSDYYGSGRSSSSPSVGAVE